MVMDVAEKSPKEQAASLVAAQRWLALATVDEQGVPTLSYVPFAPALGAFVVVVSRLAAHTPHLLAQRPASVLIVGDHVDDPYSRSRLSVDVAPRVNPAGSQAAHAIWSVLQARHGETVAVLRTISTPPPSKSYCAKTRFPGRTSRPHSRGCVDPTAGRR